MSGCKDILYKKKIIFWTVHTRQLPDSVRAPTIFSLMNKTLVRGWNVNKGQDRGNSFLSRWKHPFCQLSIIYCGAEQGTVLGWSHQKHALRLCYHTAAATAGIFILRPSLLAWRHVWGITFQCATCLRNLKHRLSWVTWSRSHHQMGERAAPVWVRDKAHHTRICASLTHKAVIFQMLQPHRKVSLGIIANLRRIKMFLTDWPLHLFPEVTLVTIYRHFFFLFLESVV